MVNNTLNLEQISRALVLGCIADHPMSIVGRPGIGKSSIVYQVAEAPKVPYAMYDFNLSDKDRGDVGGLPTVVDVEVTTSAKGARQVKGGAGSVKRLEFLIASGLLPFDTDEKSFLFLDELDRAPVEVQNMAQRIILDRRINGHTLSPNCRIFAAMNGRSDVYTNDLSDALRNRMCFLEVETDSQGALDSWLNWADAHDISPMLQGFAKFTPDVWNAPPSPTSRKLPELALATPRSFAAADRLLKVAEQVNFKTTDIIDAVVAGCIGHTAAQSLIEFRRIFQSCPTIEQVEANPQGTEIPDRADIRWSFGLALVKASKDNRTRAAAVTTYITRFADEEAAHLFKRLTTIEPSIVTTSAYQSWNRRVAH